MAKRVAFHTLGCKLNQAETSVIRSQFLRSGFTEVDYGSDADVLVINSCTVTDTADSECRQIIRRGLAGAPKAAVAVTGCYAQLKPEEIASIEGVRGVFGATSKMSIAEHAHALIEWDTPRIFVTDVVAKPISFVGARTSLAGERSRAYLKLQDGCDYSCTFCTIPLARGRARAMQFEAIQAELAALAEQGYHEVVLTGINLGEYHDSGSSVADQGGMQHHVATQPPDASRRFIHVLELIDSIDLPFRVRISSIEPNTLTPAIIERIASSNTIVPHLHVPLQSGSAELLRLMRRRYNPDMYRSTLLHVRRAMPNAAIGIDVIVGFPGETEALFEESIQFIQSLPFTYLHVFTYSERSNTPASGFAGRVDVPTRKARTARLRALSSERAREFAKSQLGTKHIVISDRYDATTGNLSGITENNVQVTFAAPVTMHRTPQVVELVALAGSSNTVLGTLI